MSADRQAPSTAHRPAVPPPPAQQTPRAFTSIAALSLAAVLAGCVPRPAEGPPPPSGQRPADFPAERYERADGGRVYRIDPQASSLRVYVYREGALARLGHNHIVSTSELHGYANLAESLQQSTMDLYVALDAMIVDDPELRAAAGEQFASTPSEEDKAGTRANMLGEATLDTARYPFAVVSGRIVGGTLPEPQLDIAITLHGTTKHYSHPAQVEADDVGLRARGELSLQQSEFGISPFSVLGGALRVQDEVRLVYDLRAKPVAR